MLALLMTLTLALADEPPATATAVDPLSVGVTAEPLGSADDRGAYAIEKRLRAEELTLRACWKDADDLSQPLRYLKLTLTFRSADGALRKAKVVTPTGLQTLDDCGLKLTSDLRLDPPPRYNDRISVMLTWALPEAIQ